MALYSVSFSYNFQTISQSEYFVIALANHIVIKSNPSLHFGIYVVLTVVGIEIGIKITVNLKVKRSCVKHSHEEYNRDVMK